MTLSGPRKDLLVPVLIILLSFISCSPSISPDNYIERGSRNVYQAGQPEFYISAFGVYDDQNMPVIRLFLDLTSNSLTFKSINNTQSASATAYVDITRTDGNKGNIVSDSFDISLTNDENEETGYYNILKEYSADPGMFEIEVTLKDGSSSKSTTVSTQTFIPEQQGATPHLTNIQLFGLDKEHENSYQPLTIYDIPSRYDSLKFVYQVTNNQLDTALSVYSELLKFKSDTTPARSMGSANYASSSIYYEGIDYDDSAILQTNKRTLLQKGSVLIEYKFALKERGNYRFQVRINPDHLDKVAARDFSIKSENYPNIKTPIELARPLYYLMSKGEYEELLNLKSNNAIKNKIDRFWLKHIGDKEKARQTIDHYYSRVESANKLFSNFKEGWKTDRGMMYILFGPPLYSHKSLNSLEWFYSYNRSNPRTTFSFERPKSVNQFYPFGNYLLQRTFGYNNVEYKQKRLWLTGLILSTPI